MKKIIFWFSVIGIMLSISCDQSNVYRAEVDVPGNTWHKDSSIVFKPQITNTSTPYNIYITIENTTNYPYQNLWLFINTKSDKTIQRDSLNCFISDGKGNYQGEKFGETHKISFSFKGNIGFPRKGEYKFEIFQGMRRKTIKGIESIGLKINEARVKAGSKKNRTQ